MAIKSISKAACLGLFFAMIPWGAAHAKGSQEVVEQSGLFILEGFQQAVGLDYAYSGHTNNSAGGGANSSQSKLAEIYQVQTGLSILDPHLLNFALSGDVGLEQLWNSIQGRAASNGNNTRYQYNLAVNVLDRSWHPLSIFSSRSSDTVVATFSPSFETTQVRNGIEAYFVKKEFTSKFRYETNTLDIHGGTADTSTTTDLFMGSAGYKFRDINFLSVNYSLTGAQSTGTGQVQKSYGHSIGLSDTLFFGPGRRYSLASEYISLQSSSAGLPQSSVNWNETFDASLGKALNTRLDYRHTSNSTAVSPGLEQVYTTDAFSGQLTHRLYQSLTTRLVGSYVKTDLPGGTESRYSGLAGLQYHKNLPDRNSLKIGINGRHDVTDRSGTATERPIINEPHTVNQANEVIALGIPGRVKVPLTVQGFLTPPNLPPLPPTSPDQIFVEGVDYTVDYQAGTIRWGLFLPRIPNIVVSYTSLLDPSVKYSSDSLDLTSSLSLLGGRLLVNGYYSTVSQTITSGDSQNGLFDTTVATVNLQAFLENHSYTVEYSNFDSGTTKYQYLEGGWQYDPMSGALKLQARDRYTMNAATGRSAGSTNNSFTAAASWLTNLRDTALLQLSANFIDSRSDKLGAQDSIFLQSSLRAPFNKLVVSLVGSVGWRFSGSSSSRDDNLRLQIMRFF
jgi:hypothetical protein